MTPRLNSEAAPALSTPPPLAAEAVALLRSSIPITLKSFKTGALYHLVALDQIEAEPERIEEITRACNEPKVYENLFRARNNGSPYTADQARSFLAWGRKGWDSGSYFVFVITTTGGEIVGALDIKSADTESAEIGYWLSAAHSGLATNAVLAISDVARRVGYRSLFALVKDGNQSSRRVLERADFDGPFGAAGRPDYVKYTRQLR